MRVAETTVEELINAIDIVLGGMIRKQEFIARFWELLTLSSTLSNLYKKELIMGKKFKQILEGKHRNHTLSQMSKSTGYYDIINAQHLL